MRLLFISILALVHISMYGQVNVSGFVVKDAYYISIDINSKNNYPIMFDAVLNKKDSLLIDTSNKQNFITGILQNSIYVPRCWSHNVFLKLYGDSAIDTHNKFRNMFFDEMAKNGGKKIIELSSGDMAKITFIKLKGIFVQLDKEISFSYGLNQEDYPQVNKPCIPIAITEYESTNKLPIIHTSINNLRFD